MDYRLIRQDEKNEAIDLMKECFHQSYYSIFFLHPETTVVAVENGKIVGGVNMIGYTLRNGKKALYVGWIYVSSSQRGKGIAKELYSQAVLFAKNNCYDELNLLIEGDNPSSFKPVNSIKGFKILTLKEQLKRYKLDIFKVWKISSHIFDMGYFLWVKDVNDNTEYKSLEPKATTQIKSLCSTLLLHFILSLLVAFKFSLPFFSALILPILLLLRTALQYSRGRIYLSWDSPSFVSVLASILLIPFPNPGNVYIKGSSWTIKEKNKELVAGALIAILMEAIVFMLLPLKLSLIFVLPLLLLDTVFSFYPFCGFLASRVKRGLGKKYKIFCIFVLFLVILKPFLEL